MRPFLGTDLTHNKKNNKPNGLEFLVSTPSLALSQSLDQSTQKAEETVKKSQLSTILKILQLIACILFVGALKGILQADVSLAEGYRNAPWAYWCTGASLAVWLGLVLLGKYKSKTVLSSEESTQTFHALERVTDAVMTELEVPAHARQVDVLSFYYKEKNQQIKACSKGMQFADFFNLSFHCYADSDTLYLISSDGKYAFPRSSLKGIRTVKKHLTVASWHKDASFDSAIYKPYKLTMDQFGCIHCRCYYILELEHNGAIWGIYFPSYELPGFEAITGLKA